MRLRRCRLSQIDGQTSDLVLESKFTSGCSDPKQHPRHVVIFADAFHEMEKSLADARIAAAEADIDEVYR